jgi:TonB family protein
MKKPGIYRAFGFSVALHLSLLFIGILIIALSPSRKLATNYVVTLVESPGGSSAAPVPSPAPAAERTKSESPPQKKAEPTTLPKKTKQEKLQEDQLLSDRVAALKSKRKIENIVANRRLAEVSGSQQKSQSSTSAAKAGKGKPGGGDYVSLVTTKIRQNWIYPESSDKMLETTVLLRVRRDGSATVDKIIKSSGSPLFDRSVLRAITKASPFPPPPQEIEIEARFYP